MNAASQWRMAIARKIAPHYAAYPKVDAVVVLGGVARGWADAWSDLDLVVYWREPPTEHERRALIAQVGGQLWDFGDTFAKEPDPTLRYWAEDYYLAGDENTGFKVDIGHHLTGDMNQIVEAVTQRHDPHPLKQEILYSIKRVQVLSGQELVQAWIDAAGSCPEPLARRFVEENLRLPMFWKTRPSMARGDWLTWTQIMLRASESLLKAVVALNREYYPGPKRQAHLIDELAIKPDDFDQRLTRMVRDEPESALAVAYALYDDVLALAQTHMPQADLAGVRNWFFYQRKQWAHPPEDVL